MAAYFAIFPELTGLSPASSVHLGVSVMCLWISIGVGIRVCAANCALCCLIHLSFDSQCSTWHQISVWDWEAPHIL